MPKSPDTAATLPLDGLYPDETLTYTTRPLSLDRISAESAEPSPEFIESLKRFGQINPVVVRQEGSTFVLIAGRRRYAAAKKLEWPKILATIVNTNGASYEHQILLIENNQRKANAYAEYTAIRALLDDGYTIGQIAKATGIPVGTIKKRLAFDNLTAAGKSAVETGSITPTIATDLSKLDARIQEVLLADGRPITLDLIRETRSAKRTAALAAQLELPEFTASTRETPQDWSVRAERVLADLTASAPVSIPDMLRNALATMQAAILRLKESLHDPADPARAAD